jgi:hypothetical protein
VGPDLVVRLDDDRQADASALRGALDHSVEVHWTGVAVPWGWTEHLISGWLLSTASAGSWCHEPQLMTVGCTNSGGSQH